MKIKEIILVTAILLVSFFTHFTNMFNYPYYENDEGTYMSQAWSLISDGKIAPYTYWYDHAPAGWFLIAAWVKLTGGFFTFNTSVNSGRVLMLLIHVASSFFLYYIARKTTGSKSAGIITVLLFSFSPLGIYFGRRVLLDNIMIFWVLMSLAILIKSGKNLISLILSATVFGIAILTKENAIFFIPVFLYFIYTNASRHQREFLVGKWLVISLLVTSTYFLYAILKGEFLPVGFMGNTTEHVSLITTLKNQYSRGIALPFWDTRSYFYINFVGWLYKDPIIMIVGILATVINFFFSFFDRRFRIPAYLSLSFWLFLLRGKLVIDFYIVPLVPILALNIGVLLALGLTKMSFGKTILNRIFLAVFLMFLIFLQNVQKLPVYTQNETRNQIAAIDWIKKNIPKDAKVVIDDAIYVDLHAQRSEGDPIFENADWSWKIEKDPEVLQAKLQGDWSNIQYLVLSHEILKQIKDGQFPLLQKALTNSEKVFEWKEASTSYVDIKNYISTNGDWMAIYKIHDKNKVVLEKSWEFYKSNFIKSYGQVVDPATNNTTSEGQSYAMLRAVIINDRGTFDNVWAWTKDHLQHRVQDNLLSWLWLNDDNGGKLGDSEAATDADEDVALSLIFAYKRWGDEKYLIEAKSIINDIWDQDVVKIKDIYYLLSGPGSEREEGYIVNPSYLAPANYKIFAEVDSGHDWYALADDSYKFLDKMILNSSSKLPPDWVLVDKDTGKINAPTKYISDVNASWYGFNAFRLMWRVALDKEWSGDVGAKKYLESVSPFYEAELDKTLYAIYSLDGIPRSNYSSLSTTTGAFFAIYGKDKEDAERVYNKEIGSKFNIDEGFWADKNNYYDQNWAWFAAALNSGYFQKP